MAEEKLIDREDWTEHYVRQGNPKAPTYYIIRFSGASGLFAKFVAIAARVKYAITKNWIPVVDMQNYPNFYLSPEKFGKENAWEYYFEQPMRIGLEEAFEGENVILSGKQTPIPIPFGMIGCWENKKDILAKWQMLVDLGFLKVKPELMEEILAIQNKLFPPKERILGAHLRGTDYLTKPHAHPIPPNMRYV